MGKSVNSTYVKVLEYGDKENGNAGQLFESSWQLTLNEGDNSTHKLYQF